MVGEGHQVGAEPIRLETLQEEYIISKKGDNCGIELAHPGIPRIKLVEVYEHMPAVDGISAHDLSGGHSCCSHGYK